MIVLLGPTGETARRILAIARSAGVELRLAARDPSRAREQLGPLCGGLTIATVDARDAVSVEAVLDAGDVLINAATPAGQLGHGLARAAIGARAHYVAFTGEVVDTLRLTANWMRLRVSAGSRCVRGRARQVGSETSRCAWRWACCPRRGVAISARRSPTSRQAMERSSLKCTS